VKPVNLRVAKNTNDSKTYSLGVPVEIARLLEAAHKTTFTLELTSDGVLYRPILNPIEPVNLPDWLKDIIGPDADLAEMDKEA
jgi:hypothetical protein